MYKISVRAVSLGAGLRVMLPRRTQFAQEAPQIAVGKAASISFRELQPYPVHCASQELFPHERPETAMDATLTRILPAWRQVMKRASGAWDAYQRALESDPLRTKALTSLSGLVLADCLAQAYTPGAFDAMRTVRMGCFGLAIHGPLVRSPHNHDDVTICHRANLHRHFPRAIVPAMATCGYRHGQSVSIDVDTRAGALLVQAAGQEHHAQESQCDDGHCGQDGYRPGPLRARLHCCLLWQSRPHGGPPWRHPRHPAGMVTNTLLSHPGRVPASRC